MRFQREPDHQPVPLQVLVADDQPLFRGGLHALLDTAEGFEWAGEAADAAAAIGLARSLAPDVVILGLGKSTDVDVARTVDRIAAARPGVGILLMPETGGDAAVVAAIRAGARGYVLKSAPGEHALRAVRAVGHGELIVGADMANTVARLLEGAPSPAERAFPDLTCREREVLALIAEPSTTGQAADRLGLSQKTVRNHMSNICTKLQVVDRTQAVLAAREAGIA